MSATVEITPKTEIESRVKKMQENLREQGIVAAIITQNVDTFYFTGSTQRGHMIIPAEGEAVYLVNKSLERAKTESPLSNIEYQQNLKTLPLALQERVGDIKGKKIGMELDVLPTALYLRYKDLFSGAEIVDVSLQIRELRMIKSPYEINILRQVAEISRQMLASVPDFLKAGRRELDFAADLEHVFRILGHQGMCRLRQYNQDTFYGHVMSGASITVASLFDGPTSGPGLNPFYPQGPSLKIIEAGDMVLVDYVTTYKGYCVDNTRVFCLGEPPAEIAKAHKDALIIHEEIIKAAKPGTTCSELANLAYSMAAEMGYEENFMGYGSDKAAFIGHGVGLELDELPVLTARQNYPMTEGMVFALEPKILFKDKGIAGVENTVFFNGQNLEKLIQHPEEIICV